MKSADNLFDKHRLDLSPFSAAPIARLHNDTISPASRAELPEMTIVLANAQSDAASYLRQRQLFIAIAVSLDHISLNNARAGS